MVRASTPVLLGVTVGAILALGGRTGTVIIVRDGRSAPRRPCCWNRNRPRFGDGPGGALMRCRRSLALSLIRIPRLCAVVVTCRCLDTGLLHDRLARRRGDLTDRLVGVSRLRTVVMPRGCPRRRRRDKRQAANEGCGHQHPVH